MKITLITQYLEGHGGTERVISNLVNEDLKNEYQVLIPKSGKPEWLQWITRTTGYQLKICHAQDTQAQKEFIEKNVLAAEPDIVLGLEGRACVTAYQIRKKYDLHYKIVSWGHTSIAESNIFSRQELAFSEYHLAISTGIKKQLIKLGVPAQKIFLIYNPIRTVNKKTISTPKANAPFHAIFIGRILLDDQKNVRMLLESIAQLNIPWKLDIFGKGADLPKAKTLANDLHISQNINWQGWMPNPWEAINEADCLLLCSKYEGFPMVVIEAASYGLPIVSTNCPTGPADIINSHNGILTPMNDQKAFIAACRQIYRLRGKYNHTDIKKTVLKFDISRYIKHIENIYNLIAADNKNTDKSAIKLSSL